MGQLTLRVVNSKMHRFSLICCLTLGSIFSTVETKSQNTPKPPLGYKSKLAILAAYGNGSLEIIDRDIPLPQGVVLKKNIEYGKANGHPLHLDLYRPAKLTRPVPALLFIHGGHT